MSDYHFGYGSNLDLDDWKEWCNDNDRKSNEMQVESGIFFLPDYELAFHYESGKRGGGALDVIKKRGHAVAGKLFKVTGDAQEKEKIKKFETLVSYGHSFFRNL